jgi:hypothetical protein
MSDEPAPPIHVEPTVPIHVESRSRRALKWVDANAAAVNAFATVAIALLTLAYVTFTALQLWQARNTAERTQRAYVVITDVLVAKADPKRVNLAVKNTGSTPASDLEVRLAFGTVNGLQDLASRMSDLRKGSLTRGYALGAGQPNSWHLDYAIPVIEPVPIVAWGRVDYRDVFGKPRWQNFSGTLRCLPEADKCNFEPTAEGNDFE